MKKQTALQTRQDKGKAILRVKQPTAKSPAAVQTTGQLSNRTVQRLLAQRAGDGPTELDDTTAGRINRARGGGQTLDTTIQQKMGEAMGSNFSGALVDIG